jgi:hypothetical protein
MKKQKKFTGNTTLAEVLKHPKSSEILEKYGVPCLYCPLAIYEMSTLKLKEIAKRYGIDIKSLLKELNKSCKK